MSLTFFNVPDEYITDFSVKWVLLVSARSRSISRTELVVLWNFVLIHLGTALTNYLNFSNLCSLRRGTDALRISGWPSSSQLDLVPSSLVLHLAIWRVPIDFLKRSHPGRSEWIEKEAHLEEVGVDHPDPYEFPKWMLRRHDGWLLAKRSGMKSRRVLGGRVRFVSTTVVVHRTEWPLMSPLVDQDQVGVELRCCPTEIEWSGWFHLGHRLFSTISPRST